MKLTLLAFVAFCFTIISCKQDPETFDSAGVDSTQVVVEVKKDSTPLIERQRLHMFSDGSRPDTFLIRAYGSDLLHAIVYLTIVSPDGNEIYKQEFTSDYLLGFGPGGEMDSLAQVNRIADRINEFFAEQHFLQPAIKENMTFDGNYTDKASWDELKLNRRSIGYTYLLGKEDKRWIAWSARQRKVVMYYNCC